MVTPSMKALINMFEYRGLDNSFDFSVRKVFPRYYSNKPKYKLIANDGGESDRRMYIKYEQDAVPISSLLHMKKNSRKLVIRSVSKYPVKISQIDKEKLHELCSKIYGYNSWKSVENGISLNPVYETTYKNIGVFKLQNFDTILPLIPSLKGDSYKLMIYKSTRLCNSIINNMIPCDDNDCNCHYPSQLINKDFVEVRSLPDDYINSNTDPTMLYSVKQISRKTKTMEYTIVLRMISSEIYLDQNMKILENILDYFKTYLKM